MLTFAQNNIQYKKQQQKISDMGKKKILTLATCLLIITLMTIVSYSWKDFCNNWYYFGAHCFFLKNRAQDIIKASTCVFWEEAVFRFAPFLIASISISLSKPKWLKHTLYPVFSIIIICIQLQFGALHYNILTGLSYKRSIIIHGIQGIILAITYALTMIIILIDQDRTQNNERNKHIKQVIIANLVAYCNSAAAHAISNVLLVFTQTF